jgi:hypothetical protein
MNKGLYVDSCVWSSVNRKGLGFAKEQFMRIARRIKNPGTKKAIRIFVLVSFGFILTEVGELRAQERSDLTEPSNAGRVRGKISGEFGIVDEESATFPTTLTFDERIRIYRRSFTDAENLIGPALGAGIGQLHNSPVEWGQGVGGFGRRLASGYGQSAVARTIAFGVGAAADEDSRFVPSNQTGIWRRTRYAVVGTFVSRTRSGRKMPAISLFAGAYGAAFVANAWEPPSQNSATDALKRGSTALLSSVGWHVLKEFWPDIRRAFRHKQKQLEPEE